MTTPQLENKHLKHLEKTMAVAFTRPLRQRKNVNYNEKEGIDDTDPPDQAWLSYFDATFAVRYSDLYQRNNSAERISQSSITCTAAEVQLVPSANVLYEVCTEQYDVEDTNTGMYETVSFPPSVYSTIPNLMETCQ